MISEETANQVLKKLDGWVLIDPEETEPETPDPYPDSNNKVTLEEVDDVWGTCLSDAKLHIRNNPGILQTALVKDFWEAVICWAAAELWRKYNHVVESPGEEAPRVDNRARDLYFNGKRILDNLRISTLQGLS